MDMNPLPFFSLAEFPTPIHCLTHLSRAMKGPALYMKRDDLTSMGLGGNKTRKLEFLVGQALEDGCKTLVTAGGIQSNHCRLTAAAARKAGLDVHLVLNGTPPKQAQGNLLLDEIFGATLHFCTRKTRDTTLEQVGKELEKTGKKPYLIPVGGSNAVGAVGYAAAMTELSEQLKTLKIQPDAIVFATSSGGTQAGLTLGARLTGFKGQVLGMSIDQVATGPENFTPVLARIAVETAQRLKSDIRLNPEDFSLNCDYLGAGYARPGELEFNAIRQLARHEGILLGPVYTARAMGGLLDLIEKQHFTKDQTVLFWHTGGAPEVFAWADQLKHTE